MTTAQGEPGKAAHDRLRWDVSVGLAPLGLGYDAEPVVLDWFGQGHPDLLLSACGGARGRMACVFPFLPKSTDVPAHYGAGVEVPALAGYRHFCPIPNGSASRFDLVAAGPEGLVWFSNQGQPERPELGSCEPLGIAADLGVGAGQIAQIIATDWDGDGKVDLLVGYTDLAGYWPEPDAVPVEQIGFNQRGVHPGYDRSGRWRGKPPVGRVFWLRNQGPPGAPRFVVHEELRMDDEALDLGARPAPLAICWGGAGAWELLVSDARGAVKLYRNFGGQRPPVLMDPRPLLQDRKPLRLPPERTVVVAADLDSDRRDELLYGTADGRVFAIHSAPGRDEAAPAVPLLQEAAPFWVGGRAVVAVGDLDADGDLDLVVGDATGRLSWVRDVGTPSDHRYALPIPLDAGGEPFRLDPGPGGMLEGPAGVPMGCACPLLADWSDHGRLDLILTGASGEVLYLRNNGVAIDPRFDYPRPLFCRGAPLLFPPRMRPASADWNGRGQQDLIALDLQGFLCLFPRIGKTELGPPTPLVDRLGRIIRLDGGFGQAGRCALWAGPWTGPGQIDLLVGLPRSARYVLPPLLGKPVADLDRLSTVVLLAHRGHGTFVARPLTLADGRPLITGTDGCSPCGVASAEGDGLDLLVGADDGRVLYFARGDLRW